MAAICRGTIIKKGTPFISERPLRSLRNDYAVYGGIGTPLISEWLRRSAGICIDDSGNNISNQYYNENIDLYLHGDFEELLIRTQGVVAVMCATNSSHHSDDIDILRAVTSKGTWETFACYPSGIASVEIEIKMQGNYNVDTVESIITSYGHATVSIASVTGSEYGVGYVINNATILQREISQDGQAVTFVLQFDIDAIIGNGAFYKGTFELSITGGPSGGRAIDCSPSNRQAYPI